MTEREPTQAEVQQAEPEAFAEDLQVVPVKMVGPVRSQQMPATSWNARSFSLDPNVAVKIADRDPRKVRVSIIAQGADAWIGESQAKAKVNVGVQVALGGAERNFYHTEEIWAIAATGTSVLSIAEEYWTE